MHGIEWLSILNFLQTALRRARNEGEVELLGREQCDLLRYVVKSYLNGRTLDPNETDEVVGMLEQAGFSPLIPFPAVEE